MSKNKDKILSWILAIGWMMFIFYMSSMGGEESTEQSDVIVEFIKKLGLDINGEIISFIVRKAAHVTEYMILFFLIYRVVVISFEFKRNNLISLIVLVIYATSDEIHQLFVGGREGCIRDVCIDSLGGIIGIIILMLINRYINRKNQKSLCK